MLTFVFGFLSFIRGIDPSTKDFFQLAFFAGGVVTVGGLVGYFALTRKGAEGEPVSKFDRLLEQRKAALGALPIGLLSVLVGALWYVIHTMAPLGISESRFSDFNTPGIIAFLGFGTLYVAMATWLAIRAERAAIRTARDDAEVSR